VGPHAAGSWGPVSSPTLTDTIVEIEGESMRPVTWCVIEEVASGESGIGGQPMRTEDPIPVGAMKS
jgi:4-oxalocrotonate tautomerase